MYDHLVLRHIDIFTEVRFHSPEAKKVAVVSNKTNVKWRSMYLL